MQNRRHVRRPADQARSYAVAGCLFILATMIVLGVVGAVALGLLVNVFRAVTNL